MRLLDVSVTYFTETLNNFCSNVCVCVSVCVGCDSYIWTSEGKHFTLCCTRNNEETLSTAVLLGACCIGVVASAVRC